MDYYRGKNPFNFGINPAHFECILFTYKVLEKSRISDRLIWSVLYTRLYLHHTLSEFWWKQVIANFRCRGMCFTECLLVFTVQLHVMQCMVLLSQFCLSVSPSVRCMYCDKTKLSSASVSTPYKIALPLVFPLQLGLLGIVPFNSKYLPKVTHPLRKMQTSTDFRS